MYDSVNFISGHSELTAVAHRIWEEYRLWSARFFGADDLI